MKSFLKWAAIFLLPVLMVCVLGTPVHAAMLAHPGHFVPFALPFVIGAQNIMYITDSALAGDLKNLYEDIRQDLVPVVTPLLSAIKKKGPDGVGNVNWGGNNMYFDVVTQPEVNWGWSPTGQLPYSTQAQEVQGNVGIARFYVTRAFDRLPIVGTQTKEMAFISLREKITRAFAQAYQLGMEEALQGNATGVKAVIATASTTVSIAVISPYGISGAGQGGLWLKPQMYISVYDATGVTNRGTAQISAVGNNLTSATGACTLTLATGISNMAATDIIVGANQSGDSLNGVMNGLANITNRGSGYTTLHGLSAATYGRWDAIKFTAGTQTDATTCQEMDIWTLATQLFASSGFSANDNPDEYVIVTTFGIGKQLIQSVLAQRMMPVSGDEKIQLPNGYKCSTILGIPLIMDPYCPLGTLYLLHLPSLFWVDALDWSPVQYESSGTVRFVTGQDAYEISMAQYINTGTKQRNANASIISYTDGQAYNWNVANG